MTTGDLESQCAAELRELARQSMIAGGATVALLGAGAIAVLFGFDTLFEQFHLLSFSNDFWQLNPATDRLIQMFPQGFWFDAAVFIALLAALLAAVVGVVGWLFSRRRPEAWE